MKFSSLRATLVLLMAAFLTSATIGYADPAANFTDLNQALAEFQASLPDGGSEAAAHKVAVEMLKLKGQKFAFNASKLSDKQMVGQLTKAYSKSSQQAGLGSAVRSTLTACAILIAVSASNCGAGSRAQQERPAIVQPIAPTSTSK